MHTLMESTPTTISKSQKSDLNSRSIRLGEYVVVLQPEEVHRIPLYTQHETADLFFPNVGSSLLSHRSCSTAL